jgi:hypothetical protein
VQRLPIEVREDIARRVDAYLKLAKAAKGEDLLARIRSSAREEQAKAIGKGANMLGDFSGPSGRRFVALTIA